jgi:hypothetical protein
MRERIKIDKNLWFSMGYILITLIVWLILYWRIQKRGGNFKKNMIKITTIQGVSIGLLLSIVTQSSILLSLFFMVLFGFMGYTSMSSIYRMRKSLGKKDE